MESKNSIFDYFIPYWPFLMLTLGFMGGYMRMNYGIMTSRFFWWSFTMMFWFSLGVIVPDVWHPAIWWLGPLVGIAVGVSVLFLNETGHWLKRKQKNMQRREARRRDN